jgi:acyl-CoA dehydrogenase
MFDTLADTPDRVAICNKFDDNYWAEKDRTHAFPFEFARAIADGGWLGIAMPTQYGGTGLGITDAAIVMREVGRSAGATPSSRILPSVIGGSGSCRCLAIH